MIEVLVALQLAAADATNQIREHFEVAALLPPRLLVVRLAASQVTTLQKFDGVAAVAEHPAALNVEPPLSQSESLFVAGWAARGVKSGPRAGDGLAWDAPGFEPPGRPLR